MNTDSESLKSKLNLETAKIPWRELQTFFAAGMVLRVDVGLDLLDVAEQLVQDNAKQLEDWLEARQVSKVEDEQALAWYDADTVLWALVIKPWVLVQEKAA